MEGVLYNNKWLVGTNNDRSHLPNSDARRCLGIATTTRNRTASPGRYGHLTIHPRAAVAGDMASNAQEVIR
jgi:hypothetical protein